MLDYTLFYVDRILPVFAGWKRLLKIVGILLVSSCTQNTQELDVADEGMALPPSVQSSSDGPSRVVRLNPTQAEELDIETAPVILSNERFPLDMPGTVFPAPDHIAIVSAPINGRVDQIYAHEGERVRVGQVLATLESLEFATIAANFLQAKADELYMTLQVKRLEVLVEKKISPLGALQKAQADLQRAGASVRAVSAQLKTLGVSDAQLKSWQKGEDGRPVLSLRAPISGVMDEHLIDLGQAVTAYEKVLSIVNLDRVMVRGYLSPNEASLVRPGDSVVIYMGDLPGQALHTRVATINPALDEIHKSVTVNTLVETRDGWPIPGQRVDMRVQVETPDAVLTIPIEAVQYEGGDAAVYVAIDVQSFEKRIVEVERVTAERAIILSGIVEGEYVAVSQVFSLKALDRYELYAE